MSELLLALAAAVVGGVLYRLRGGWLKTLTGIGSTQACRALWALPTAALLAWLAGWSWLLFAAVTLSVFLSMALIGHGAHMIYGPAYWPALAGKSQAELLTGFWIKDAFGGAPQRDWPQSLTDAFNMTGMSAIGLVRNALAVAPLFAFAPVPAALYAATGLAHGPLYWLGWQVTPDIRAAEVFVGALSWAAIVLLFGGV